MRSTSEPEKTIPIQSGGVNIGANGDASFVGDVVGRDKNYVLNNPIFIQIEGRTELRGDLEKVIDEPTKKAGVPNRTMKPQKAYRRKLVYRLDLKGNQQQISDALSRWRFVANLKITQPLVAVADGIVEVGLNTITTSYSPPILELKNCGMECELCIKDNGGDPLRWAGIRVRGFLDDIQFGYLVYLRSQGSVELYRARQIIGGENRLIVAETKNTWTKLRLDVFNSKLRIWVNGELHIDTKDSKFQDKGLIYLHTFGTQAQFRNLRIYELIR